jgi:diguanylate cyclase (GGDEF)-like protein
VVSIAAGVLVLLIAAFWLICRRALRPLSALQAPLRRVAHGQTDFDVTTSGNREIVAIVNALRATANALDERDRKLTHLALRDELTGLLNRNAFDDALGREVESTSELGHTSALLFVDLDQFKYINDSLSHGGGDRLLKLAAERLRAIVRPEDVVGRFGGDKFMVLLRRVAKKEAAAICREIVNGMQEESFSESGRSLNLRCSIGATMIRGSKTKPAKLLSRADTACYQAKSNGRNQFCFYKVASKEIAEIAADGNWWQRIQTALKQDAFVLHYQPIMNIRTRETACYEALLRMSTEEEELAFPGTFLPAAARLGLTVDIDHWVIRESLRSLAALRSVRGDTCFTLNVSGSTFDRPDFRRLLETELHATGVPFDAIIIEITEQIAMRDPVAAAAQMAALVERGCRFAIDDFGSGYCSYNYLKNLPVAFVKIDGSFIANLAEDTVDQRIVAAIAEVAAATDCETIAEHVKDYDTLRLLDGLGVSYAQGYFLGRPSAEVKAAAIRAPLAVAARRRAPPRRAALRQRVLERSS